jgi:hypothetical protein
MAWDEPGGGCRLIPPEREAASPFDARLREAAPLLYGSLLDLVRVMEERAREYDACSDLWDLSPGGGEELSRRIGRGSAEGGVTRGGRKDRGTRNNLGTPQEGYRSKGYSNKPG